jgi:hypothetical protein
MTILIPIKNDPNHQINITLDEEIFRLRFLYNENSDCWTMDIKDVNGNLLLSNIRLVPNFPLIKQYVNIGLPKGDFICNGDIDTQYITKDSFAKNKFKMLYITEAEIEAV